MNEDTAFFNDIYARWKEFLLDKRRDIVPNENIWVRVLPDGMIGLDNVPLDDDYRWQDIFLNGKRIHRRWNTKVWFIYFLPDDFDRSAIAVKAWDEAARQEIFEALEVLGDPGFFLPGKGYVQLESEDAEQSRERVVAALGALHISYDVAPLWHIKGEEPPCEEKS